MRGFVLSMQDLGFFRGSVCVYAGGYTSEEQVEWMHDAYKVPNFLGGLVSTKEGC